MKRQPKRIQRKRTKGWRLPANAVVVTRPGVFGNPWAALYWGQQGAVERFDHWVDGKLPGVLEERRERLLGRLHELVGKDLACYCHVDACWCHADVLLKAARKLAGPTDEGSMIQSAPRMYSAHVEPTQTMLSLFPDAREEYLVSSLRELFRLYEEPHRHYHTVEHVRACLAEVRDIGYRSADRDVVDFALICHDVFYEPRAVSNERRSAAWCRNVARLLGRPELGPPVAEAILLTAHVVPHRGDVHLKGRWADAALVCDVDISILGADDPAFDEYEAQIRQEYDWVPEAEFRVARAKVLRGFLENGPIYRLDRFRDRYQARAEYNLKRSLARLEAP